MVRKAKCHFWGRAAPLREAAGWVMATLHPKADPEGAQGCSGGWAATQIVPKVLILLSYRGAEFISIINLFMGAGPSHSSAAIKF